MGRFHPSDPRSRRRYAGSPPSGATPVPSEPTLVQGETIYIQLGYVARVRVYARDEDGVDRKSETGAFASSDDDIFSVVSVESVPIPNGADNANYWEVLLAAGSIGTATLSEQVDAETNAFNSAIVRVTETITVVVYQVATSMVLYFTEEGADDEVPAYYAAGTTALRIPVNKNATLRIEGRNGKLVVPLSNVVFDSQSATSYHFVATADPNIVTLVTDSLHLGEAGLVTADGDPSPSAASLSLVLSVGNSTQIATNLVEFYSTEPR